MTESNTNPFLKALKERSESTETETTSDLPEESGSGGPSVRLARTEMVEDYDGWAVGVEESSLLPTLTAEAIRRMEDSFREKSITDSWITATTDTKLKNQLNMAIAANSQTIVNPGNITGSIANQFAGKTSAAGKLFGSGSNYGSTATIGGVDINQIQKDLQDFKTWSEKVNQRLSILTPKPELLEKYEALKQAYEHYLTLERLVMNGGSDDV